MVENAPDHRRVFDERDQCEPAAAARACEDIEPKTPLHQLRPQPVRHGPIARLHGRHVVAGRRRTCLARLTISRGDAGPPRGSRAQHAVIQQQVDPRPGRQRRQPLEQRQRLEHEVRGRIRPSVPEVQNHLPLRRQVQPLLRDRWAEGVSAETLEPHAIPRWDDDARVQVETVPPRVARSEALRRERQQLRRRTTAAHGRTGPLAERQAALDGRGRNSREHRGLLTPSIRTPVVADRVHHATAGQEPLEAPIDGAEHPVHLVVGRWIARVKAQRRALLDIHLVQDERMHVDVQVQRGAKALDDRHRPAAPPGRALLARATAERSEHGAHEDARDGAAERVVPGEHVSQPVRQAQHPLPHRDHGEDVIHQVRSTLGHAPAAAARTHRAAFARERNQAVQPTSAAMEARESTGQKAAAQESVKLLFNEPRQPVSVVGAGCLDPKALEVVPHDLIQHALGGRSWGVRGGGTHAPAVANSAPPRPRADWRRISRDPPGTPRQVRSFCVPRSGRRSQNLPRVCACPGR
jgi:hypothetical protein